MFRLHPARVATFFAALLALAWPGRARAEADSSGGMLPRDVGLVVQPSAAKLPTTPPDFDRLDDGWLVIEFPATVRDRVGPLIREGEEARRRLSEDLGQPVLDHALVRIARTPEQMAQLSPEGAPPPAYAAGVAYPSVHVALLALQAPDTWEGTDLRQLLRHELSHLALADAVSSRHVPRWFDEGLAIQESGELWWARTKTLWDATLSKRLLPLAELDRGFPNERDEVGIAYAESADLVRFLMRDSDRVRFGSLVQRVRASAPFDRALEDAYGTDERKLEYEWREEVARRFGMTPMLTGGGLLWVLMVALAFAAWVKRRRRAQAKLAQWAREEAAMDQAISTTPSISEVENRASAGDVVPVRVPSLPVVEHEGRWYTLH
jgi:hypothetical protein